MQTPETYDVEDMMRIFRLSRQSVYRRVREARAGRGGIFLPITAETKQSLRWSAEAVKALLQNTDNTTQTTLTLKIESANSRQKRHTEAMKKLERFGIKIQKKEQE